MSGVLTNARPVDLLVKSVVLTSIAPKLAPAQAHAFIQAHDQAVEALVAPGWLGRPRRQR